MSIHGAVITYFAQLIAALIVRRWLKAGVVLAGASGVMQLVWAPSFNPAAAAFFPYIFHALGSNADSRWRRFGLWAALSATVLPPFIMAPQLWPWKADELGNTIARTIMLLIACGAFSLAGWAVGYMKWQRHTAVEARVAAQIAQVETARLQHESDAANHRERIATDMHDVVAHSLAVIAAQSDGARYALRSDPDAAEQALDVIGDTARTAIGDLRRILTELRFAQPDGATASATALEDVFTRLRASGMDVDVTETGTHPGPGLVALTVQRVAAEALTNALKYGDLSKRVEVDLRWHPTASQPAGVTVRNVVAQQPTCPQAQGTGHGIAGMRQRAAAVGGRLRVEHIGAEFVVELTLPPAADEQEVLKEHS